MSEGTLDLRPVSMGTSELGLTALCIGAREPEENAMAGMCNIPTSGLQVLFREMIEYSGDGA